MSDLLLSKVTAAATRLDFLTATGELKSLDSLQLMDFVLELEAEVGVNIPPESLRPANFESLTSLIEMLTKLS